MFLHVGSHRTRHVSASWGPRMTVVPTPPSRWRRRSNLTELFALLLARFLLSLQAEPAGRG
jgi:hypothetical protein